MTGYLDMKTKAGVKFKMLNLVNFRFIIESETLGEFRGFDRSETTKTYAPRWLRAERITRVSPEVWHTNDPNEAMEMIGRVLAYCPSAYLVRMVRR